MRSSRARIVTSAAVGLLLAAAYGSMPRVAGAAGAPGGGGTNGLLPETYFALQIPLKAFLEATSMPQPDLFNSLRYPGAGVSDVQSERLVRDTIGCALRSSTWWSFDPANTYAGEGLLTPDDAPPLWQKPLTYWPGDLPSGSDGIRDRMEDIHTCLITRLNASGKEVPIFLSGPHVTPRDPKVSQDNVASYPFAEAIWLATLDATHAELQVHVWPVGETVHYCTGATQDGPIIKTLLTQRVCGTKAGAACKLTVHLDPKELVDGDPNQLCHDRGRAGGRDGIWECRTTTGASPKPAIMTRRNADAWKAIYGGNGAARGECDMPPSPDTR